MTTVLGMAAWCSVVLGTSAVHAGDPPVRVGILIPFTGSRAATGADIERAVQMAVDTLNDAGGINGRRFELVTRDSHSDMGCASAALSSMLDEGIVALVGPEDSGSLRRLLPVVEQHRILHMVPSVTAPPIQEDTNARLWLRMAPTADVLGCALAIRASTKNYAKVLAIDALDTYNNSLVRSFAKQLPQTPEGRKTLVLSLTETDGTASIADAISSFDPDAILLADFPATGAVIMQQVALFADLPWLFGPTLHSEFFVRNAPEKAVADGLGIIPKQRETEAFFAAYARQWGSEPAFNATYYYDAVAILGLGLAAAAAAGENTEALDGEVLLGYVRRTANGPGASHEWESLAQALEAVNAGLGVNYNGISSLVEINEDGVLPEGAALLQEWRVDQGEIVTGTLLPCYVGFDRSETRVDAVVTSTETIDVMGFGSSNPPAP